MEKLRRIELYATSPVCRRRILLSYFGEVFDHDCGNCDICRNPPQRFDGTILAQKALSAIVRTRESENTQMIVDILRGNRSAPLLEKHYDEIRTYSVGKTTPPAKWNAYIMQLIHLGAIAKSYAADRHLSTTPYGWKILRGEAKIELAMVRQNETSPEKVRSGRKFPDADGELFEILRELRKDLAYRENVPAYRIFSDKVLSEIAKQKPASIEELAEIPGIGNFKLRKYGEILIREICRSP